ncbi:MAG: hypothetical protein RLY21_2251 [Planctomycetota bacterium]|jgi:hypothetical protein
MQRFSTTSIAVLAAASALSTAFGQNAPAKPGAAPVAPPATATALPSADLVGYRLPLLREGSVISRVVGDITLDPDEKHWVFRPIQPESGNLRREFVLLPSATLADMLRNRNLSPSPIEYEVTGRVFIYKGRNYLFPELAPPIVRFDTRPSQTPSPEAKPVPTPNGEAKFVPPPATPPRRDPSIGKDDDATVDAIERRLEQRVGRTPIGKLSDDSESPTADREKSDLGATLPEAGTRLVLRSGRLMRDPSAGSWRFVPEQVTGKGDESLEILPCLLLERLELTTRESDSPPSILISGQVVVFNDAAYLMPTSFRRAREGRGLGR